MCFSVKRLYGNNCYIGQVDGDPAHDTGTTEYTQQNCKRTLSCPQFYKLVNQSNSGTSTSLENSQTMVQIQYVYQLQWITAFYKVTFGFQGALTHCVDFINWCFWGNLTIGGVKNKFLFDYWRTHWICLSCCRVCPLSEFPSASGS